ncbi:hypothetical protein EVG20_g4884 [Dentipellis fragilis]|uniref:Poly A polymerase head domain-containing protein n=1 Tax=Dentipellis fragilis TaxID=205917 RepID=A0A4Y9YWT5_9AGAM|nr:hypothetical protein EVG20_g4884 [Dentipellis fragilis]
MTSALGLSARGACVGGPRGKARHPDAFLLPSSAPGLRTQGHPAYAQIDVAVAAAQTSVLLKGITNPRIVEGFIDYRGQGMGQRLDMWHSTVEWLSRQLPNIEWILPQAEARPVTYSHGQLRPSWFNISTLPPGYTEWDEVNVSRSVNLVESIIQSEIHGGVDSRKIVLMGFSQGAALSLMVALTSLHELGGVASLSGWIPHNAREHIIHSEPSLPVFWGYGRADTEIPPYHSEESMGFLRDVMRLPMHLLTYRRYDNLAHTVNVTFSSRLAPIILPAALAGSWSVCQLGLSTSRQSKIPYSLLAHRLPTLRRSVFSMGRPLSFLNVTSEPIHIPERMEIRLTDVEDQLCTLLDECTKYLAESQGTNTSCRIAGGWVRDKLLGSQSNDIDIALTDMMGYPFAVEFSRYAQKAKKISVKEVTTVKGNPGQSKHLETAKTAVLGLELDFVNLRAEEYAEGSRIPTKVVCTFDIIESRILSVIFAGHQSYGTPEQDALRRDTTINSLFYNVHSREVEDYCGRGLEDLRKGLIRTPLPPRQTFLDDPLRVVRCIRFASRFGFKMVPELQDSARDYEIQTAIAQKITRERVGEEIDKMMRGTHLIDSLALSTTIFYIPPSITLSSTPSSSRISVAAAAILRTFLTPVTALFEHPPLHPLFLSHTSSQSISARLYLACALSPYRGLTYTDHKGKTHLAVEAAIREGLKIGTKNHYLDGIPHLFNAAELLKEPRLEKFHGPDERVAIGLLLRNPAVHNPLMDSHWTVSLLFSLVQELTLLYDAGNDNFDVGKAAGCIDVHNAFVNRVVELGLDKDVDSKPILDGREVAAVLDARKPGPWMAQVMSRVVEWQLGHPEGSKAECSEWLKAERDAGKLVLEDPPFAGGKRGKHSDQAGSKKSKR